MAGSCTSCARRHTRDQTVEKGETYGVNKVIHCTSYFTQYKIQYKQVHTAHKTQLSVLSVLLVVSVVCLLYPVCRISPCRRMLRGTRRRCSHRAASQSPPPSVDPSTYYRRRQRRRRRRRDMRHRREKKNRCREKMTRKEFNGRKKESVKTDLICQILHQDVQCVQCTYLRGVTGVVL